MVRTKWPQKPTPSRVLLACVLMRDPVIVADGHTYERIQIEKWIRRESPGVKSPKTNEPLPNTTLLPNHTLKSSIEEAIEDQVSEMRVCKTKNRGQ